MHMIKWISNTNKTVMWQCKVPECWSCRLPCRVWGNVTIAYRSPPLNSVGDKGRHFSSQEGLSLVSFCQFLWQDTNSRFLPSFYEKKTISPLVTQDKNVNLCPTWQFNTNFLFRRFFFLTGKWLVCNRGKTLAVRYRYMPQRSQLLQVHLSLGLFPSNLESFTCWRGCHGQVHLYSVSEREREREV